MDPYNPFHHSSSNLDHQSSSYLDLLQSQVEGQQQENSCYESFPHAFNLASEHNISFSQPSDHTPASQDTPDNRKERKKWIPSDDEVLISAWLNTSKDNIVGNQQKGGCFWKRVGEYYAASPKSSERGEEALKVNCKQRWHKINDFVNKFCAAYSTAERQNTSGHSQNDVLRVAHEIYHSDHKLRFNMEHCWCLLRYEQKWLSLNMGNTSTPKGSTKRKPAEEASQEASSNVQDTEMRPEGVKAAKTKKISAQGKALADYKSMWEIKKEEMAETEKLQKLAILDTLLAKKEPLSASDEAIKDKIVNQYF
ncbi:glutathione S-transferase T3-like [Capsella rubella]|uniref:glutathione S-transferase T3-like n=1 Tax=Capsella rubella TaxID=81985 RepID=UPI000CD4F529|nr:glutathione S-transferase T3-like [Capsella rubella]